MRTNEDPCISGTVAVGCTNRSIHIASLAGWPVTMVTCMMGSLYDRQTMAMMKRCVACGIYLIHPRWIDTYFLTFVCLSVYIQPAG